MNLRAGASTDVGLRRQANEDRYAMAPDIGLYLVADGMGGHRAGQVASEMAAEAAIRAVEALQGASVSPAEKLRHAVACANREIHNAAIQSEALRGMGTTLVSILVTAERLALAHVGDSRAYLVRNSKIRCLTDDHSVVGELLRKQQITEAAAREHPHRHVLTRALGVREETLPDLAELTPQPGDAFLMCSDGLIAHLSDSEILQVMLAKDDPQAVCEVLVDVANKRGGVDNTTVLVVRYEK
ncbi:MAG: Stp1/IreP family PP2C-type Ser/Thr phosphatase [Deltaproteobacteria bacterium]|nr:Stp1/IreP family PP2C-type Ser/Thr phosphatase [Deltaproteobacteria bacterium]